MTLAAKSILETFIEKQLRSYGLNPHDWIVTSKSKNLLMVESLEDPQFSFLAHFDFRKNFFKLHLYSI